jgi:hypothetical protein
MTHLTSIQEKMSELTDILELVRAHIDDGVAALSDGSWEDRAQKID